MAVCVCEQDCVSAARAMSEAEGVSGLCRFEQLDLLHPQALHTLSPHTDSGSSSGAQPTVVFLYVYPTLLGPILPLVRALATRHRPCRVVTLVYHFSQHDWPPSDTLAGGRIQVYGPAEDGEGKETGGA